MSNNLLFHSLVKEKISYSELAHNHIAVLDEHFNYLELEKIEDCLYYRIAKSDNYASAQNNFSHRTSTDVHYFIKENDKVVYFVAISKNRKLQNKLYNLRKSIYDA